MNNTQKLRAFEALKTDISKAILIPDSEWSYLYSQMEWAHYNRGDYLIEPNQISSRFFYIDSGLVKRFCHSSEGKQYIISFDDKGRLVSEYTSLIKSIPTRCYVQAIEETNVLVAKPGVYLTLRERHPNWIQLGRIIAETRYVEKCEREYDLLLHNSKEKLNIFKQKNPSLISRVQQKDIAAYIGITPESLNRLMKSISL